MFLYENNKCPVCNKEFAEGDDIVACPECGTPHHRECYQSLGRCANKNLHGSDFVYNRNGNNKAPAEEKTEIQSFQQFAEEVRKAVNAENSENIESENIENTADFEHQQKAISEDAVPVKEIDGVTSLDAATVVGVNSERFIKRFIKNRKLGWNWGAFFFGPYYFMYRKLYTESLIFLIIPFVVNMIISSVFSSAMLVLNNIYTEMYKILVDYDYNKLSSFIKESFAAPENKQAWMIVFITMGISLLLRIIAAAVADSQYRKRVVKIIKIVDEKVNHGESFSFVGPMMGNENMSQSELRKMFLAKQGGVNIFFPLILLALSFFSYMF